MHIGGMRTALYAYCYAKSQGGQFLLRLEDTDVARHVVGADKIIYNSLMQAGLVYDEGPDIGGPCAPYVQSARKDIYDKYMQTLLDSRQAYYCFCTQERLAWLKTTGHTKYDKHCLQLDRQVAATRARTESHCIRQNIPPGTSTFYDHVFGDITIQHMELEDNVLIKSDGMPTYNYANVIDDHTMGITHVIRGVEYLSSTPKYNLLYDAFGWQRPEYIHLQPIMRDATHKLSKRHGDASYDDYIAAGYLKQAIINYIALLGWSGKDDREKYTLDELVACFSLRGLSKSSSIFDLTKLKWLNSVYIKELSHQEFLAQALPYLQSAQSRWGYTVELTYLATLLQSRCEVLTDCISLTDFMRDDVYSNFDLQLLVNAKQKTTLDMARAYLPTVIDAFKVGQIDLAQLAERTKTKLAQIAWIVRVGTTGALVTPGGATEMVRLLGLDRCIARLSSLQHRLGLARA
jgi:glutamyl-tRNA synthetase